MALPLIFQTTARSIRPPSSGRPGRKLKTATMRLLTMSPASSTPGTVPPSTNCMPPQKIAASTSDSSGPTKASTNSRPGVSDSFSISETPPKNCSWIRRTGSLKRSAATVWASSWISTEA
jgi:hypothetical protein